MRMTRLKTIKTKSSAARYYGKRTDESFWGPQLFPQGRRSLFRAFWRGAHRCGAVREPRSVLGTWLRAGKPALSIEPIGVAIGPLPVEKARLPPAWAVEHLGAPERGKRERVPGRERATALRARETARQHEQPQDQQGGQGGQGGLRPAGRGARAPRGGEQAPPGRERRPQEGAQGPEGDDRQGRGKDRGDDQDGSSQQERF
jgi:hypothetical protein